MWQDYEKKEEKLTSSAYVPGLYCASMAASMAVLTHCILERLDLEEHFDSTGKLEDVDEEHAVLKPQYCFLQLDYLFLNFPVAIFPSNNGSEGCRRTLSSAARNQEYSLSETA